uniref:Uncharacterized protein n=1 Tax=Arundo donax TaxID=35708 RepID=A0A0A9GYF2_ARUDO
MRTFVSKFFCRVRHPVSVSNSDTYIRFRVLSAVSQKNLSNRTPVPESDTDTRTRVRVTLHISSIVYIRSSILVVLYCFLHREYDLR